MYWLATNNGNIAEMKEWHSQGWIRWDFMSMGCSLSRSLLEAGHHVVKQRWETASGKLRPATPWPVGPEADLPDLLPPYVLNGITPPLQPLLLLLLPAPRPTTCLPSPCNNFYTAFQANTQSFKPFKKNQSKFLQINMYLVSGYFFLGFGHCGQCFKKCPENIFYSAEESKLIKKKSQVYRGIIDKR